MSLTRSKLYTILLICCTAGYIWIYIGITTYLIEKKTIEVCPIKYVTNIPCPSCGSSRSVIELIKGNFINSLKINPLGYVVAVIMVLSPIWILIDIISKKNTFFCFYQKIEIILKQKKYAIPFIVLVIINWIWNITKGL